MNLKPKRTTMLGCTHPYMYNYRHCDLDIYCEELINGK